MGDIDVYLFHNFLECRVATVGDKTCNRSEE
jgi:hypothetical protein